MFLPAMSSARRYKNGRPTKRTPDVVKKLFDAIKEGVPFKLACMYAGITYECFNQWRQKDPDFDRQVDELVAKPAIDLFKIIRKQAPETWQAGALMWRGVSTRSQSGYSLSRYSRTSL